MPTKIIFLTTIIACILATSICQRIIISDKFVNILARKSIKPIFENINHLSSISKQLTHFQGPLASTCRHQLIKKAKNFEKTLSIFGIQNPRKKLVNTQQRSKRGLRVLGNVWCYLSDTPCPNDLDHYRTLEKNLKNIIKDESSELSNIEAIINSEQNLIHNLTLTFSKLNIRQSSNAIILNKTQNNLNSHIKVDFFCNTGKSIGSAIQNEIYEIGNIVSDAKFGLPNLYMFPPNHLSKIIADSKSGNLKMLFHSTSTEMLLLYQINCATTVIHDNHIISIMSIPAVSYEQLDNQIFHNFKNHIRLEHLESITKKPIDILICNKNIRFSILMSSKDLKECRSNIAKTIYICKKRIIHLYIQSPDSCNDKLLAETIVIQLSNNYFLIDSSAGPTQIICNNHLEKTLNINSTTSIYIPDNCQAKNLNFLISALEKKTIYTSSKFELVKVDHLPKIKFDNIYDKKIKNNFQNISKKFSISVKNLKDLHSKTSFDIEKLQKDNIPKTLSGTSLGISSFIIIAFLISIIVLGVTKQFKHE